MIRLAKGPEPDVLRECARRWTEEYLQYLARCEKPPKSLATRYRDRDIKSALKDEAHEKCVYCESHVLHVDSGETDHIEPVTKRPDRAFDWTNMAFACHLCNWRKLDYYHEVERLLDPFSDEPAEHLFFAGCLVYPTASARGRLTIERLDLNRSALIDSRRDRLNAVHAVYCDWLRLSDGPTRDAVANMLRREAEDVPVAVELHGGGPVSELFQAGEAATSGAAVATGG